MTDTTPPTTSPNDGASAALEPTAPRHGGRLRTPSLRVTAALAAGMLGVGVAVGAAIGPAPQASFAGAADSVAQRLPLLLAELASRPHGATSAQAPTASTASEPPAVTKQETPAPASTTAAPASITPTPAKAPSEESAPTPKAQGKAKAKLPAVTNVWLIELAGTSFSEALAQPTAAPSINQLVPTGTLLSGWSALTANAFAADAVLAEPPAAGATPPLLHSIVQPPCPEGSAGTACAAGTPGQLTAADEFLKATLSPITGTPLYREHGLVVITFTTVGIASQAGLPAGASSATLTYQPPAGVLLLSPFVHAGIRSTSVFNPTSPRQSLEKLLH
jgi:hypothetical protein